MVCFWQVRQGFQLLNQFLKSLYCWNFHNFFWNFCVSENKMPLSLNKMVMALPGIWHGSTKSPSWFNKDSFMVLQGVCHGSGKAMTDSWQSVLFSNTKQILNLLNHFTKYQTDPVQPGLFCKHLCNQFIHLLIKYLFCSELLRHCLSQTITAGDLKC